jgi:hypothetical protein
VDIADDDEIGELLDLPHCSVGDSEIRPGDGVLFRLRPTAVLERVHPTLRAVLRRCQDDGAVAGEILAVLPGYEPAYVVKPLSRGNPELCRKPLVVRKADILNVMTKADLDAAVAFARIRDND